MKKTSKVIGFVSLLVLILSIQMVAAQSFAPIQASIGYVTDGNAGMKYQNDDAWIGMLMAGKELGFIPELRVSQTATNISANLSKMASSKSLTVGTGYAFSAELEKIVGNYTQKSFAVIDSVVEKPNVCSIVFRKNEGAFLAGIAAAKTTKTGKLGFIGAYDIDIINEFLAGYRAGAVSVSPNAQVLVQYAETFDDIEKLKEIAIKLNKEGADVIMHAAGVAGQGLFTAADEKGFWAIGVDYDQYRLSMHNKVLCSAIYKCDVAAYLACKDYADGGFGTELVKHYGIREHAVALADGGKNLNADTIAIIEKYRNAISTGELYIPANLSELRNYKPLSIK